MNVIRNAALAIGGMGAVAGTAVGVWGGAHAFREALGGVDDMTTLDLAGIAVGWPGLAIGAIGVSQLGKNTPLGLGLAVLGATMVSFGLGTGLRRSEILHADDPAPLPTTLPRAY